ncbi:MAG: HD-GYP domain-containing protein (c-di-GMP phosphodiesterase class II) [Halioglobus sp.]|jgi:HD-GYP domain-containing protein (c-di-GMP phosphodiesterase class II)
MLKTLKIPTSELDFGMFVSALDRDWLETPFVTQGFLIEAQEDLDRVREICEYVYIDSRRGRALNPSVKLTSIGPTEKTAATKNAVKDRPRVPLERIFGGRIIQSYRDDSNWEDEHPRAQHALNILVDDIDHIFSQVHEGEKLNVIKLRKSVDPIVDSISRNPDACIWVTRLKKHDQYTYKHSLSAAIWSISLGRQIGLQRQDLRSLAMGCMLMDVGKLRVNPELLQADRDLTSDETAEVAGHVRHGLAILEECGILNQDVIDMVAHHHERYDGSGYPLGLMRDEIPPFARIAAIVDTYDAITSNRDYAPAVSPTDAIKILYKARDEDFQAELVESFIQAIGLYPAGTLVELSSGEVGVVVAEYRTRRLRPKIMLLLDAQKNRLPESRVIDLQELEENPDTPLVSIRRSLEPEAYDIDLSAIGLP